MTSAPDLVYNVAMQLYDVGPSLNCRKIRVLARELALSLELVPVDLTRPRSDDYLRMNPMGKVPTFVDDDGLVLWESHAILVHLAEKRPEAGLMSTEPRARAEVFRWLFFAATHVQPWVSVLGVERVFKPRLGQPSDAAAIAYAERELARYLAVLNDALKNRDYLTGSYSIADIAAGCGLENSEARGIDLSNVPYVAAWRERLRARPAWRE